MGARALLTDALGSTVALGDGTGSLVTQYTYEPFGVTSETGVPSGNGFKYTGREDDGSGLLYYRARYYHPRLQRFISEDPIGFNGGSINLYAYVLNNPITFVDPNGTAHCLPMSGCVTHPTDGYCYAWVTVTPSPGQPGFVVIQIGPGQYKGPVPTGSTYVNPTGKRGGSGNSDSMISGSLASPRPPKGGIRKERGDETDETESRSDL